MIKYVFKKYLNQRVCKYEEAVHELDAIKEKKKQQD